MKTLVISILLTVTCLQAVSQPFSRDTSVLLTSIDDSLRLGANMGFYIDSSRGMEIPSVWEKGFTIGNKVPWGNTRYIPLSKVPSIIYCTFSVTNNTDKADTLFLYPGMRFTFDAYKIINNGPVKQPVSEFDEEGLVFIPLQPGEKAPYLIKLTPVNWAFSRFVPALIRKEFRPGFTSLLNTRGYNLDAFGFILSGVLATMIIFTLINYINNFKKEFLYYCCFATCIFFLIFFLSLLSSRPGDFSNLLMSYLSTVFLIGGTIFYSAFTRLFLNTKHEYKNLNKLFVFQEFFLAALILLYTYLHFWGSNFAYQYYLEIFMKVVALCIGIVYVLSAFRYSNWLMNYLAVGNSLYIIFSVISLLLIVGVGKQIFAGHPLMYFEIGLVLAIVFFLLGLLQKNRKELIAQTKREEELKQIAEREKLETQLAVLKAQQDERNRISADMHDDLGAGMTAIRLYSELAKSKTGNNAIAEIDKISSSANELLTKMNAIIWSMNSANDTLSNLVAYLRRYALDYFEGSGIDCRISLPENLPDVEVPGDMRRNIFLVFKEALNNIVKHAQATKVTITLTNTNNFLELYIHDNGKGIDMNNLREFGNGLNNMKKRMKDMNIEFEIRNENGTLIILRRKITFTGAA